MRKNIIREKRYRDKKAEIMSELRTLRRSALSQYYNFEFDRNTSSFLSMEKNVGINSFV